MTCDFCPREFDNKKSLSNHQRYCESGMPDDTRRKLRMAKLGRDNPQWKDEVGYGALHKWVERNYPKPEKCADCEDSPRDAANISGKYLRDVSDWEWLCRRCHMIKDGRMEKLRQYRSKDVTV